MMKHSLFWLAMVLVVGMTLLSGVLHGRMRNRWGPSPDTVFAADKLAEIAQQFGDWRLQSTGELDETARAMLECSGYFVRDYQNRVTGDVVSVMVLLGPPGPISVHTPEICYPSRNYQSRGERQQVTIPGPAGKGDTFWALDYKTDSVQGDLFRIYYAWNTGDYWSAADDPRFAFAGQPYLYKIQLSTRLPLGTKPGADDPCRKFLQDFIPVARKCLVPPNGK